VASIVEERTLSSQLRGEEQVLIFRSRHGESVGQRGFKARRRERRNSFLSETIWCTEQGKGNFEKKKERQQGIAQSLQRKASRRKSMENTCPLRQPWRRRSRRAGREKNTRGPPLRPKRPTQSNQKGFIWGPLNVNKMATHLMQGMNNRGFEK